MRKRRKKELDSRRIYIPLLALVCVIVIIQICTNISKKKEVSDTEDKILYANIKTNQDNVITNDVPLNNVVNGDGKIYKLASYTYSTFLSSKIENDELYISVSNFANNIILFDDMNITPNEYYEVHGISKEIKDIFLGHYNTVTDFPVLFILYEDNTAEYVDIEKSFYNGSFEINGNIPVNNIKEFKSVNVSEGDTSYIGVIAIDTQDNAYEITNEDLNR